MIPTALLPLASPFYQTYLHHSSESGDLGVQLFPSNMAWASHPIVTTGNLRGYVTQRLPKYQHVYVPKHIELIAHTSISKDRICLFIDDTVSWLKTDFRSIEERCLVFNSIEKFNVREKIKKIKRAFDQPWRLYFSINGGISNIKFDKTSGILPCVTMSNHGVAWDLLSENKYNTSLVTARREGEDWNFDVDIGHEIAHAAYAPIPFFGQAIELDFEEFAFDDEGQATPGHLARMCYLLSEFAVAAVRGELRDTETGLPIKKPSELMALLKLANKCFPGCGFQRAMDLYSESSPLLEKNGNTIYAIGSASLNAAHLIAPYISVPDVRACMNMFYNQ